MSIPKFGAEKYGAGQGSPLHHADTV
jgi:hypothetical protein